MSETVGTAQHPPGPPAGAPLSRFAVPRCALVHDGLLALLVAARPLIWDEDASQPSVCAYYVLIALAISVLAFEAVWGARERWRWSPRGLGLAALVGWFALEACRSPLPMQAWGLWSSLASDLALAWYLMQVIEGRERLALAALGAGALTELVLAQLQWCWVLPGMARAQATGHLAIPAGMGGLVAERIANGGVYGTFTQANALAGYCLVALPPLVAAAWTGGRGPRVVLICLAPLALEVMVLTSSKAAYLAFLVALMTVWWWQRWRWRLAVSLALAGLTALVLWLPGAAPQHLRQHLWNGLEASAEVRIGYWDAALALLRAHPLLGVGLHGYAATATAALPVWAGYATHVHCEPLEAACEGGLVAGVALLALLAWLPWRRASTASDGLLATPADHPLPRLWPAVPVAGLGVLYAAGLGLLSTNTGWWPGAQVQVGGLPLVEMGWWVAVAAFLALALAMLRALPPPPPWSCALGLLALGLHVLVDFDLHAGGVAGTAVVVAVLAGGSVRSSSLGGGSGESDGALVWRRLLPLGAAVLATVLCVIWMVVAAREREAAEIASECEAVLNAGSDADLRQELLVSLSGHLAGVPLEENAPMALIDAALDRADALAPADYQLRLRLLALRRPGQDCESHCAELATLYPTSGAVEMLWAQNERRMARKHQGDAAASVELQQAEIQHLRRAEERDPWDLRLKQLLVDALERAAADAPVPAQHEAWTTQAAAERTLIASLHDRVDWTNR